MLFEIAVEMFDQVWPWSVERRRTPPAPPSSMTPPCEIPHSRFAALGLVTLVHGPAMEVARKMVPLVPNCTKAVPS